MLYMYVYMYVCMYVYMYACMYVCHIQQMLEEKKLSFFFLMRYNSFQMTSQRESKHGQINVAHDNQEKNYSNI